MDDLRIAVRWLKRNPGFTIVAVATLALGIGANTAIFSLVHAILLRPLPYPEPGQLVKVQKAQAPDAIGPLGSGDFIADREFLAWREQCHSLAALAAYSGGDATLAGIGEAERVSVASVTADFFPLLGVQPVLGRGLVASDEWSGAPAVVLLTHGLWQRRFGGDPEVLGRTIVLDGALHSVIGVLPRTFQFPEPFELWQPLSLSETPGTSDGGIAFRLLKVLARLNPAFPPAQAEAELTLISKRIELGPELRPDPTDPAEVPEFEIVDAPPGFEMDGDGPDVAGIAMPPSGVGTTPLPGARPPSGPQMRIAPFTPGDRVVGITAPPDQAGSRSLFRGDSRTRLIPLQEHVAGSMRTALLVLLGAVGLVLLIGCTNVANLLLARAAARKREMAVRTVLGAARRRIVRQLLVESCLLGLLGGLAGLAVAVWIRSIARSLIPADLQSFHRLELDLPVLLFTLAISLVTGLLFGLAPAWQASRLDLNSALKSGGASAVTSRGHWLRRGLAVGEIGMAMVLLIGAMLLLRSFDRLRSVSPGFDPDGVMTATISLGPMEYREGHRRNTFYREWLAEVQALPGVRFAGLIDHLPLTDYSMMLTLLIENRPPPARGMESPVSFAAVSQEYFAAMGIPIRQGRSFRGAGTTPAEVLINETLARRYFADENPLGRRVAVPGGPDQWATIVGVVGDVRQSGLDRDIVPEVYGSVDANPGWVMSLVVRADGDPTRLAPAIRDAVRRLDSSQALHAVLTMEERLAATLAPRRLNVLLLGSSALLALVMAVVGVYGVLSYLVAQRTREIGIRMALGAGSADVLFLVLREAGALIGCGLLAGMATAFASTGYLASLLYGVPPRDLVTFVVVATILGAVAMTACYLPARRAANVEPLTALRDE